MAPFYGLRDTFGPAPPIVQGEMTVIARPAATLAAALVLAAPLGLTACGGNPEREALRAYEASIEKLMEEDGRIAGRLADLAQDLPAGGAAAASAQTEFGRNEAAPFLVRFKEAAAKAPAEAERLRKVHGMLTAYLDHRLAYLRAVDAHLAARDGEAMGRIQKSQEALAAAMNDLHDKSGGKFQDPIAAGFFEKRYAPFKAGEAPAETVEEALRKDVLPRIAAIADRTKGQVTEEGLPGSVARWAAAELAFFQELAATLPQQAVVFGSWKTSQEEWEASTKAREEFIAALRAYRDSLR